MRGYLSAIAVLCVCTALFHAAPAPSAKPGDKHDPPLRPVDEQVFGYQLLSACNQIVDQYVRPVSRTDLLHTALKGLYEKAGRLAPASLKTDVEKATTEEALIDLLGRVREELRDAEGLQGNPPLLICCQAIARSLDPYTTVVTGDDQRQTLGLQAETDGFGFEIAPHLVSDTLRVAVVRPGGPAQRGGLRPGDAITQLNGQAVRDLSDAKVKELLGLNISDGPPSMGIEEQAFEPAKPLEIAYRRGSSTKDLKMALLRERFRTETVLGVNRNEDNTWNYFLDAKSGIAHVRVASFAKGTANELRDVLTELRGRNLRGLILDLRWCPGGYLDEAVDCARLFLDNERVITTVKSRLREGAIHRAEKDGPFVDVPMIVLLNNESTGGSELIAGALQDHNRARVAGQRSFGKASVQTAVHLGLPYTGMRLTSGTFLRPDGKNLHRFPESKPSDEWGVQPNAELECRLSPDANRALKEAWLLQTLRPGSSRERLLLDDPAMDVPRQMAAAAMQGN